MIPGYESSCQLERKRAQRPMKGVQTQQAKRLSQPEKSSLSTKNITCDRCKRATKIAIGPPSPAARTKKKRAKIAQTKTSLAESGTAKETENPPAEASKPSANASSKKRAKNRKAGLQALLAGQQQQKSSSLSLSDFMQKK
jgi:hypothetical protein